MTILVAIALNIAVVPLELLPLLQSRLELPPTIASDEADGYVPYYQQVRVGVRVPFLGGTIIHGGDGSTQFAGKWSDYFSKTGVGFDLTAAHLFRTSRVFAIGPYVGTTVDFFKGETRQISEGGFFSYNVKSDTLDMTRFTLGFRARENLGARFFMEQHLGIGAAFYSSTSTPWFSESRSLIGTSATYTFEVGLRAGIAASSHVDLGIGSAYETNGPPEEGDLITSRSFPPARFEAQQNLVLSFFINVNF